MKVVIVTGSAGLVGAEAVNFFHQKGFTVIGIDNDMRKTFFGESASTAWNRERLIDKFPRYIHHETDIRNEEEIETIFKTHGSKIEIVIHTAAQPSHDWAANNPYMDFTINANGTLILLENTRRFCRDACFIFTSTNKVYGDTPNFLPLQELATRRELDPQHSYYPLGIDEDMSVDKSKHSLFGVSKLAADILVQEYGRYFDMHTACFRGGCITGPSHSGAVMHGFLAYLMKCAVEHRPYTIFGYKGKQVRDNIHAFDLVNMFWHFYQNPRVGEIYNAGGGRHSNCSVLEAIDRCQDISGNKMTYSISDEARAGDHIWWISDISKFQKQYPEWQYRYSLSDIIQELYEGLKSRMYHDV
jgi:CDP-paratose 2-epimerase